MTITLYKYTGEKEKVDKSGDLQTILTTSGQFKADTSMLAPSLILALPTQDEELLTDENGNLIADVQISVGGKVLDFNYFYVAEFRRYYYVSSIIVSSQSLIIVTGDVDPLFSFKDEILENYALVERNEYDFSVYEQDELLPLKYEKKITETTPTPGVMVNTTFSADIDPLEYNVIITLVSAYPMGHDNIEPPSGTSYLPEIESDAFAPTRSSMRYQINSYALAGIGYNLLGDNSTFIDYIKSVIAFPFVPPRSGAEYYTPMYFGAWANDRKMQFNGEDVKGYTCNPMSEYIVVADFNMPAVSSFLDYAPFSHYEVYIPFYGWYELPYEIVKGDRLIVYYAVNYEDGSATAFVYDVTKERCIFSTGCQLGVKLGLSSSNQQQLITQKNAENTSLVIGLLASVASIAGGIFSENPMMIAGGVLGGVKSVTGYINANAAMFNRATATFSDSATALYTRLDVRLRITKTEIMDDLNMSRFAHQVGRPLRNVKQLKTLSGFTQISKIHLEGCTALDVEKRAIESSLLAGVIL